MKLRCSVSKLPVCAPLIDNGSPHSTSMLGCLTNAWGFVSEQETCNAEDLILVADWPIPIPQCSQRSKLPESPAICIRRLFPKLVIDRRSKPNRPKAGPFQGIYINQPIVHHSPQQLSALESQLHTCQSPNHADPVITSNCSLGLGQRPRQPRPEALGQ